MKSWLHYYYSLKKMVLLHRQSKEFIHCLPSDSFFPASSNSVIIISYNKCHAKYSLHRKLTHLLFLPLLRSTEFSTLCIVHVKLGTISTGSNCCVLRSFSNYCIKRVLNSAICFFQRTKNTSSTKLMLKILQTLKDIL